MRYARLGLHAAFAAVSIAGCHSSDSSDESGVDLTTSESDVSSLDVRTSDMRMYGSVFAQADGTAIALFEL